MKIEENVSKTTGKIYRKHIIEKGDKFTILSEHVQVTPPGTKRGTFTTKYEERAIEINWEDQAVWIKLTPTQGKQLIKAGNLKGLECFVKPYGDKTTEFPDGKYLGIEFTGKWDKIKSDTVKTPQPMIVTVPRSFGLPKPVGKVLLDAKQKAFVDYCKTDEGKGAFAEYLKDAKEFRNLVYLMVEDKQLDSTSEEQVSEMFSGLTQ
jgi:hypothetical protein